MQHSVTQPAPGGGTAVRRAAALVAATGVLVLLAAAVRTGAARGAAPVALGSLMSEFSPYAQSPDVATAGEMKASSDFYSDEGAAPKGPARAWTGDGGAAFNYLQSEASSPIDEAEQDRDDTLDGDAPHDSDSDLYGSYLSDGEGRRGRERESDTLQRMRSSEKARRSSEDKSFFAGVERAFGKKTGDYLMKKFDPTIKSKRRSSRRRQPRSRSRHSSSSSTSSSASSGSSAHGLMHPGVLSSAERMQKLMREFKDAKGGKRKALLKSKVLALQKQIEGDFAKVSSYGKAAETALKRAEAKERKANHKVVHKDHGHLMHIGDPL